MTNKLSPVEALRKNRNNDGRQKKSPLEKKSYRVEIRFNTTDYDSPIL